MAKNRFVCLRVFYHWAWTVTVDLISLGLCQARTFAAAPGGTPSLEDEAECATSHLDAENEESTLLCQREMVFVYVKGSVRETGPFAGA